MQHFHGDDHIVKRGKKRKRGLAAYLRSDVGLFVAFLVSASFVSISIFILPWFLEKRANYLLTSDQYQHHSVDSHLQKETAVAKQHMKKNSVDAKSSSKDRQDIDVVSDIKEIDEKNNSTGGFFLSHSTPYHTIFSTGCSIFQDWQSYVFFYHVFHSGQEGHITRIASGCNNKDETKIQEMFEEEIKSMRPGLHHLHLTPDYSRVPKKSKKPFKYFNKPYGVRHWMEHELGYPKNHELHDDSIIILMDPDQIMLRPFTNDFTNSSEKWRSKKVRKLKVEHGSPFAQQYGYGLQWLDKVKLENVFLGDNFPTPVSNLSRKDAFNYFFAMGPPYIATAKDMWSIVNKWSEIAPLVHNEYPHLLAEMFAYNLAIAHLGMRHTIANSFHVSDPWSGGEGWSLIEKTPESNICKNFPASEAPHVLHYCQRYFLGKWFIGKYKLRKDFISCKAPLLMHPPDNLASKYTTAILPGNARLKEMSPKEAKMEAFLVCAMIDALNAASKFYKDQHCKDGSANYDYSYVFHEDMLMPNETNSAIVK